MAGGVAAERGGSGGAESSQIEQAIDEDRVRAAASAERNGVAAADHCIRADGCSVIQIVRSEIRRETEHCVAAADRVHSSRELTEEHVPRAAGIEVTGLDTDEGVAAAVDGSSTGTPTDESVRDSACIGGTRAIANERVERAVRVRLARKRPEEGIVAGGVRDASAASEEGVVAPERAREARLGAEVGIGSAGRVRLTRARRRRTSWRLRKCCSHPPGCRRTSCRNRSCSTAPARSPKNELPLPELAGPPPALWPKNELAVPVLEVPALMPANVLALPAMTLKTRLLPMLNWLRALKTSATPSPSMLKSPAWTTPELWM